MALFSRYLAFFAVGLNACYPAQGDGADGSVAFQVQVFDQAVFAHVERFEIHVFKELATDGNTVTCSSFPATYTVESQKLVRVADPLEVETDPKKTGPRESAKLSVPAGEPLVFIARGLANWTEAFVVGRGCRAGITLEVGSSSNLEIDVRATTGRHCINKDDCEPNLACVKNPEQYPEGYCAFQNCAQGTACPPGSVCIPNDSSGGVCMKRCESISDCEVAVFAQQACDRRQGVNTVDVCSLVCVHPTDLIERCCGGEC